MKHICIHAVYTRVSLNKDDIATNVWCSSIKEHPHIVVNNAKSLEHARVIMDILLEEEFGKNNYKVLYESIQY